ncbi:MAG TPA: hypothetical protein VFH11_02575 [Gemmatimonadota bacterium]|nr:hypothetical protein [Gemmatimonadota bacterium]
MRTSASPLSVVVPFAVALMLLGAACAGEETGDDLTPADTAATATEEGAPDAPVATGLEPGQSSTSEAVITNTMPHAMVVTIQYEGGGETELGIVPAGGEQTFTLPASTGETVTLVASDEADTHSRDATIILSDQTETWTIE